MNAPDTRTRPRRRTRRSSPATRLLALFAGLGGAVAVLALIVKLTAPDDNAGQEQQTAAVPTATAVPVESAAPTPSLPAVDINSWELRLIDFDHPLGEDFAPPELTLVADNEQVDSRVAPELSRLFSDAQAAGYTIYFCSGYRDYDTQYTIYWNHIDEYQAQGMSLEQAHEQTRLAVQYPGCSEHQSGLCADILESRDQDMEPYIGGSGLMLWLEQNCANYGYVIRYPKDKTEITGIEYEPWHLRYVGHEAAAYMMEHGLCLEEFLALYGETGTAAVTPAPTAVG